MKIREARRKAMQTAADWALGADFDQFWGDALADEAYANDELGEVLRRAQREVAARIRRLARPTSENSR